ncbi:hypothetical protein ACOMHN_057423 [Nucella lapillus]
MQHDFSKFLSNSGTLVDKLTKVPMFKELLFKGKDGGFANMLQNSVDRVFIVSERKAHLDDSNGPVSQFDRSEISHLSLDVSSDGEALYVIRRLKQRGAAFSHKYKELVIDIGANDGLMYSNSFNLIQLGWDAILVEPQLMLLRVAKENLRRYADPYNEHAQHKVILVNAVLGAQDGSESFVLMEDDMESHILDAKPVDTSGKLVITVPSMTVQTFAAKYRVPVRFGVLSVDAEGVGDKILHQWVDAGFEPAYIVYEALHNKESVKDTTVYLQRKGYHFMIRLGWNYIFEHQPSDGGKE